jgi:hypothetical protein
MRFMILLFSLLLASASAEENKSDGVYFLNSGPSSLSINVGNTIVTIHPDGTIEYGEGYTPDAAAKALWDAVGIERKARNCPAEHAD